MAEVSTGRAEFKARGVCVQRGACVARDVKALHEEINASLRELLRLPGKAQDRHFLHFPVTAEQRRKIVKDPTHQREYTPKMSPKVEAVVRSVLEGKAGAILESVLGRDPQLSELLAIVSHPGAKGQTLHSDSQWSATSTKLITVFLALHDIDDEIMGPTRFCPETHEPSCFEDGQWIPPPDGFSRPDPRAQAKLEQSPETWFSLQAGDCVVMEPTCWHRGGANMSDGDRSLLALSFVKRVD